MKKGGIAVVLSGLAAVALFMASGLKREPACVRIQAKLELAKEFCDGLAEKAAKERCSSLSDDVDVMGQCMRVIVPSAHSACMSYINMERLSQQSKELCQ